MDGDLYDEFGNYIGPDLESDDEEENAYGSELAGASKSQYNDNDEEDQDDSMSERQGMRMEVIDEDHDDGGTSSAIVLHEVCLNIKIHMFLEFPSILLICCFIK